MVKSTIEEWLDAAAKKDGVAGVLLIDGNTGLSLGARGVAQNEDAPYIKFYCETELSNDSAARLEYKGHSLLVKVEDNIVLAIYRPLSDSNGRVLANEDGRSRLSFEGT